MKDKLLFTPGPLTTSATVKEAMLRDFGSRDFEFIQIVQEIRKRLLAIGEVESPRYEAILMQGSGTFGLEAVLSSTVSAEGKVLSIVNGSYGKRITQIAQVLKIPVHIYQVSEMAQPSPLEVKQILAADPAITHVVMAHCETTSGIMNPVQAVGDVVAQQQRIYFVDAMSTFGAVPLDLAESHIDYLVSSANKCIEGVPGFSFVLARRDQLLETEGYARSLSFDLLAQWKGLEGNGQFRFTPPTHTLLAFYQALLELEEEGGVLGRAARYRKNHETLVAGMRELGFREYLAQDDQGYIITSFHYPTHPNFSFEPFYQRLNERNLVIYPGKVSDADCFRIGNIGRLFVEDVEQLLQALQGVLTDMEIQL
ncbi:MAG: 2-aminoethylphosphonate--pyruvate transaminase [Chloroflexota bacterium]